MSAIPFGASVLEVYRGTEGFLYEEEREMISIVEEDMAKNIDSAVFTPEIYGLSIAGILALVAILVLLAFGYAMLALLFVVPLIGILIGTFYIRYMKKHDKYR